MVLFQTKHFTKQTFWRGNLPSFTWRLCNTTLWYILSHLLTHIGWSSWNLLRWENICRLILRSYFQDGAVERKAWIVGFCFRWAKIDIVETSQHRICLYADITDYGLSESLVRHVTSSLILKIYHRPIYFAIYTKAQAQIRMLFKVLKWHYHHLWWLR